MLLLRSCVVSTVRDKVSIHRIGPSQSTAWSELLFATGTSTVLILSIVLRGRRHMVRLLTGQWGTNFPQAHASTRVIRLSLPLRRERSDTAKCKTASRHTQYAILSTTPQRLSQQLSPLAEAAAGALPSRVSSHGGPVFRAYQYFMYGTPPSTFLRIRARRRTRVSAVFVPRTLFLVFVEMTSSKKTRRTAQGRNLPALCY
jgi:hypothetical protein